MKCQECLDPACLGQGQIRHFSSWSDLSSHLSEDEIVSAVNKLDAIFDEWQRLTEQQATQRLNAKVKREEEKRLLDYLHNSIPPVDLEALKKGLPIAPEQHAVAIGQHKPTFTSRRQRRALLHISVVPKS